ncbi:hypothetical protein ACMFMF_005669 [Clarireedia jacksonii]
MIIELTIWATFLLGSTILRWISDSSPTSLCLANRTKMGKYSGLASLENPNALYKHFNSQSPTVSSMSSRWPSESPSAGINENPFDDPKGLSMSAPLPSCSTFSSSSSATTPPKSESMATDSSSASPGFTRSKSRSMMMERGDFVKRLNLFKEKEGNANRRSRRTSTKTNVTESATDTRSSATSSRIMRSRDMTPLFTQQEERELEDNIKDHCQEHVHGIDDDVSVYADDDHHADADDEQMPVTPTRIASELGHQNTADESYAESPSYSLGNIFTRQNIGSAPMTSAPHQPSFSYRHSPVSVPFETSPSYFWQPNERSPTPFNFHQAKKTMSLDDSNLESITGDREESSSHFPHTLSSKSTNAPLAQATTIEEHRRNESAAHISTDSETIIVSNPFTTPIHSPVLNQEGPEYPVRSSELLVQPPPEPAITISRTAFPEELPPRPMRYFHGRDRFKTTAQRQEALLERERRCQVNLHTPSYPYMMPRARPMHQPRLEKAGARRKGLNICGYIVLITVQCSFGSCIAAGSYIFAVQKNSIMLKGDPAEMKLWFWLVSSMVLLVFSFGTMTLMYLCGKYDTNRATGGFRDRLGMNEIIGEDVERNPFGHQQTFEMVRGRWTSRCNFNSATSRQSPPTHSGRSNIAFQQVPMYAKNDVDAHPQLRYPKQSAAVSPTAPNSGAVSQLAHGKAGLKDRDEPLAEIRAHQNFPKVSLRNGSSQTADTSWPLPAWHCPDVQTAKQQPKQASTQAPTQASTQAQSDHISTSRRQQTVRASPTGKPTDSFSRSDRYRDLALDRLNGLTPQADPKVITATIFLLYRSELIPLSPYARTEWSKKVLTNFSPKSDLSTKTRSPAHTLRQGSTSTIPLPHPPVLPHHHLDKFDLHRHLSTAMPQVPILNTTKKQSPRFPNPWARKTPHQHSTPAVLWRH